MGDLALLPQLLQVVNEDVGEHKKVFCPCLGVAPELPSAVHTACSLARKRPASTSLSCAPDTSNMPSLPGTH